MTDEKLRQLATDVRKWLEEQPALSPRKKKILQAIPALVTEVRKGRGENVEVHELDPRTFGTSGATEN